MQILPLSSPLREGIHTPRKKNSSAIVIFFWKSVSFSLRVISLRGTSTNHLKSKNITRWFSSMLSITNSYLHITKTTTSLKQSFSWNSFFSLSSSQIMTLESRSLLITICKINHTCHIKQNGTVTLSTLGKIFSRWHFEIFFIILPENRIWCFLQTVSIGDSLHAMSNPVF